MKSHAPRSLLHLWALGFGLGVTSCGGDQREFAMSEEAEAASNAEETTGADQTETADPEGTASPTSEAQEPEAPPAPNEEQSADSTGQESEDNTDSTNGEDPVSAPAEGGNGGTSSAGAGAGGETASTGAAAGSAESGGAGGESDEPDPVDCGPGKFLDPEDEVDGCSYCEAGTWDHDSDPATACIPHSVCRVGEHIVVGASGTTDRQCEECTDGYTTDINQRNCIPWLPCLGEEIAEGTSTAPKTCSPVAAITAGSDHRCALLADGRVSCWGSNMYSQLGIRGMEYRSYGQIISGLTNVRNLYAGYNYSCALLEDGTAKCWGQNEDGQLGGGTVSESEANPVTVSGLNDAVDLALGRGTTCALRSGGTAVCWGRNNYGQLGNGEYEDSAIPVPVAGLTNITKIVTNVWETCVIVSNGQLYCLGHDIIDGTGEQIDTTTPIEVELPGGQGAEDIVMASGGHTCVVLEGARKLACWGDNHSKEIGPFEETRFDVPVEYPETFSRIEELRLGVADTCVRQGDVISCFGAGLVIFEGELRDGTLVDIPGISNVQTFAVGGLGGCYVDDYGVPYCWGYNDEGQVGKGELGEPERRPVRISGGPLP